MFSRILLTGVTLFWLTMSFLLWQSEFGGKGRLGGTIPVAVVWKKILTAPDNSTLEIRHHEQKCGYCRWTANVGQDAAADRVLSEDPADAAMVTALDSYRLDLDGNIVLEGTPSRLRFDVGLSFTTNDIWRDLNLRLTLRPDVWEIHCSATNENIHLHMENGSVTSDRDLKLADLQNPAALLGQFNLPLGLPLPLDLLPAPARGTPALSVGVNWEARNDWINIGRTSVRAYRLHARLLDRWSIDVMVSRAGEILRVELPDGWILVSDQLTSL